MTTSPGYEFNTSQNELFQDLARKMNFVGILLLIGGILSLIMGIFVTVVWTFIQKEDIPLSSGINSIIQGIFLFLIGSWTRKAALGFFRIVQTTNNDIENLMGAIGELRKLYTLQYFLVIITIVFIAFIFIFGIIANFIAVFNS